MTENNPFKVRYEKTNIFPKVNETRLLAAQGSQLHINLHRAQLFNASLA